MLVEQQDYEDLKKENEALNEEVEKLRESCGLSQQIDYERFKEGLSKLSPLGEAVKKQKPLITAGEILDHIRVTMPL